MKASWIAVVSTVGLFSTSAVALPTFKPVLDSTYHLAPASAAGKAGCGVCHVGTTKNLNPYGVDLKKALAGKKTITTDVLKKVEKLDSDKDGVKNGVELKKGALPGDPKSK